MIDRFFGLPQHVIRSGMWAEMRPSEQSLYVILLHDSERQRTRELHLRDAQVCELSGLSSRAFCNARKKLQEHGLIMCRRGKGNIYIYVVCNPLTGLPWAGDPRNPITYRKKIPESAEVLGLAGVFSDEVQTGTKF